MAIRKQAVTILIILSGIILSLSGCKYFFSPGDEGTKEKPTKPLAVVHFIDVGQGDAILIQLPTKNILIDGGSRNSIATEYLLNKGITSLDIVIATHPHEDHIGGLIRVLETFAVAEIIDPGYAHNSKTFNQYMALIQHKNITYTEGRSGMVRELGDSTFLRILHPTYLLPGHINDASVVAKLTFKEVCFLFTGDAENNSEQQLLENSYPLASKVLKIAHHGSRTSTSQEFLDAVNPAVAVISCGLNNRYGHPHEVTLQKLSNAAIDIFRTDLQGTIIITTDGRSLTINKHPWFQSISLNLNREFTFQSAA